MLQSTGPACERKQNRKTRRSAAPSFGGVAADFLALPSLHKTIPSKSVLVEGDGKWLDVAKLCAEMVSDDALDINDKTTARDIVCQSLSAWASKHCADINVLDAFSLEATFDPDSFGLDFDGRYDEKDAAEPKLFIGLRSQGPIPTISISKKLEMLEQACPGFARTALSIAELASYRTIAMFSPQVAFHHAQNLYWMGTDNDEEFKEDMGLNEEDDNETEMFLPSEFLASFPEMYFKGDKLSREALQNVSSTEAVEVAKVILSIMDLLDEKASLPGFDMFYGEPAYFACYLDTGEETMMNRVLDDFYQSTGESESFTDLHGIASIPLNKKAFRKWKAEMEKGFALYAQLDRLMVLIGEIKN